MIARLFASRKVVLLLAGTLVAVAARLGLQLDTELVLGVLTLVGITIGGIAYEDGQQKRATVIDGATIGLDPPPPVAPSSPHPLTRTPTTTTIEWDLGTKADVVAAMVDLEPKP